MNKRFRKLISVFIFVFIFINMWGKVYADSVVHKNEIKNINLEEKEEKEESENNLEKSRIEDKYFDNEKINKNTLKDKEPDKERNRDEEPDKERNRDEELDKDKIKENIYTESNNKEISKKNKVKKESIILEYKIDGITIQISSNPGVLPDDAKISVKKLSTQENKNYSEEIFHNTGIKLENFAAFDIIILDNSGKEIQPNNKVKVSILGIDFISENSEISAYHIKPYDENINRKLNDSDNKIEIDEMQAKEKNDEVIFSTNHFSIYGVGTKATAKYEFYLDEEIIDTQIILDGEKLKQPKTPTERDRGNFKGWYLEGENTPINFDDSINIDDNKTKKYKVNGRFEESLYVYFTYNNNIIKTKQISKGHKVDDNNIPMIVLEEGKALSHWSSRRDGEAFDFNNTEIKKDTTLYAVLEDRCKVLFNTQGGEALLANYFENGEKLGEIKIPKRSGYKFLSWNTRADGSGIEYDKNKIINSDIELYAIWEPVIVNYTISYWQENANDDEYTYKQSIVKEGKSGSSIELSDRTSSYFQEEGEIYKDKYPYFEYKKHDTNKKINGDGSTVVNVYYSRKEYELNFDLNQRYSILTINGKTYRGSEYSFKAKYGADISKLWPTASNIPNAPGSILDFFKRQKFYGWNTQDNKSLLVSKRLELDSDLVSNNDTKKTFIGKWETNLDEYTLHYMLESLTDKGEKIYEHKWYNEIIEYNQLVNSKGNWSAKNIPGLKAVNNQGIIDGNDIYFYYYRDSYEINFYNPVSVLDKNKSENLKFGSSIEDKNYIPDRPDNLSEDYKFMGWYDNPEGTGKAFNFTNKKMPKNNLAFYSKWLSPEYSVKYYKTQDASGQLEKTDTIQSGGTIYESNLSKEKPNFLKEEDFIGWYWYLDGIFTPYDFNTPVINNDYVLYPVWETPSYNVTYKLGDFTGKLPKDNNSYSLGAVAKVLSPDEDLIAPKNKVFIGWKNKLTNKIYFPNEKIIIIEDTNLIAEWAEIVLDTELKYYANDESLDHKLIKNLKNNDTHKVLENQFSRNEYKFIGWNTKQDGSGKSFKPGDEIIVSNNDSILNELYAQWIKIIEIPVEKTWKGDKNYIYKRPKYIEVKLFRNNEQIDLIKIKSDNDWKYTFKNLDETDKYGNKYLYTIEELKVNGYSSEIKHEKINNIDSFKIINTLEVGSLEITKKDRDTKETLEGSEFELRDSKGNLIQKGVTNKEGKYNFLDIPFDNYKLLEIRAPEGYKLDKLEYDISVEESNRNQTKLIINSKKAILPNTGGLGSIIFTIFGIALMGISYIGYKKMRKNKK